VRHGGGLSSTITIRITDHPSIHPELPTYSARTAAWRICHAAPKVKGMGLVIASQSPYRLLAHGQRRTAMKKCPFCASEIRDDLTLCWHCGRDVAQVPARISLWSRPKRGDDRRFLAGVVVAIALVVFGVLAGEPSRHRAALIPVTNSYEQAPEYVVRRLNGTASFNAIGNVTINLYNGTRWIITGVTIEVHAKPKHGEQWQEWRRTFRLSGSVAPLSTSIMEASIGVARQQASIEWAIMSAIGIAPADRATDSARAMATDAHAGRESHP